MQKHRYLGKATRKKAVAVYGTNYISYWCKFSILSWTAVKLLKEGNDVDVRTIPAIIGGDREKRHGIVLAKSISAQKYGIKTGEPVADALKKCPDIMIIPPEHEYYREQSRKFISY